MKPGDIAAETWIINLARRPDRLAALSAAIDATAWPFPCPKVFAAIDGDKVGVPGDYSYYYGSRDIGAARGFYEGGGAFGCKQSHVTILQDAIMRDVPAVLILEDDALITPEFGERVAEFMADVPDDWQGIMLGGQHHVSPTPVTPGVVRVRYAQRTHAYIARGEYMRALYSRWVHAGCHIDWMMEDWQSGYKVYAPERWLVAQSAGKSDISGKQNIAQSWNNPTGAEPVVYLKAPRHVAEALRGWGLHFGHDRDPATGIDVGLRDVFRETSSSTSANSRRNQVRNWIAMIQGEAVSEPGTVATVWHPEATYELVRKAARAAATVYTVEAETVEEAVAQLPPELGLAPRQHAAGRCVILLRTTRDVMEQLRGHGFHVGYWRGDDGIDNGLRDVLTRQGQPRIDGLREWIGSLQGEAETIRNGVVTVWHPDASAEELGAATDLRVVEVTAETAAEAVRQLREAA